MVDQAVLQVSALALAAVFVGAALFLVAHGLWLRAYRRRSAARLAEARSVLHRLLARAPGETPAGPAASDALPELQRLSPALRTRLMLELSRSVSGETRAALARVAERLGVVDRARAALRSRRWWRRLHAARTLQTLDTSRGAFLGLLRDPHPAVRAQAAEWAGEHPDPESARALLDVLGGTDPFPRFAVQDSLLRLGAVAVGPLAEHLARHDGPEVLPALEVAAALAQPVFMAPAVRLCASPGPEVRALAAELLGSVGGREGTEALTVLLDDPAAPVRAAAARALGRVGHWPAAVTLAARLRDPAWAVRQASGLSLRALGGPGELLLRRYLDDGDRFAADMARQVLQLPRGAEAAR